MSFPVLHTFLVFILCSIPPHLVGQQADLIKDIRVGLVLGMQVADKGHLPTALGDVALDVHVVLLGNGGQP